MCVLCVSVSYHFLFSSSFNVERPSVVHWVNGSHELFLVTATNGLTKAMVSAILSNGMVHIKDALLLIGKSSP